MENQKNKTAAASNEFLQAKQPKLCYYNILEQQFYLQQMKKRSWETDCEKQEVNRKICRAIWAQNKQNKQSDQRLR